VEEQARTTEVDRPPDGSPPRVGCAVDPAVAPSEDALLNPRRELEHLDESLSEMTNLLLAGDSSDDAGVEGDFEVPPPRRAGEGASGGDVVAGVEEAQAAVEAAMGQVADALEPEPAGAEQAPGADPVRAAAEGGGAEADPASSAMRALADELEQGEEPGPARAGGAQDAWAEEPWHGEPASKPVNFPSVDAEHQPATGDAANQSPAHAGREAAAGESPRRSEPAPEAPSPQVREAGGAPPSAPSSRAAGSKLRKVCAATGAGLALGVAAALEPLAHRLRSSPKSFRHSIGWLAVWTAFNAVCTWTYVLLFRSPLPDHPESGATQIRGAAAPGDHAPDAH